MEIIIGVVIGLSFLGLIAIVPFLRRREINKIEAMYSLSSKQRQRDEQQLQELLFDIDCQKHTDTHFHSTIQ